MDKKGVGGWGEVETVKETEVFVASSRPEKVTFELRVLCGKCGEPMKYSYKVDSVGDITVIAECECMFGGE